MKTRSPWTSTLPLLFLLAFGGIACGEDASSDADVVADVAVDIAVDVAIETSDASDATDATETSDADTVEPDLSFRIMSFNVLCSLCDPANYDTWNERLAYFEDLFARQQPDLVGLQEIIWGYEVDEILAIMPGSYSAVYWPGNEAFLPYPDATVLYRDDLYEEIEQGYYWLSPTPDEPATTGFAASGTQFVRLVSWVQLRRLADGKDFLFSTTHFDNNTPSQDLSSPLYLERTEPWAKKMPVIMTGDYNSRTFDPAYLTLVDGIDGIDGIDGENSQGFSFINAFDVSETWRIDTNQDSVPDYDVPGRIDHVFLHPGPDASEEWVCEDWLVDMHVYGEKDRYPSDHYAIQAQCSLKAK